MELKNHVIKYAPEYSMCTGCKSCELLCAILREGVSNPSKSAIKFVEGPLKTMQHEVLVCQHCAEHPCYNACPKKDKAMCIDENGIVYVNKAECIGCGLCMRKCAFTPSRISIAVDSGTGRKYAVKCDLCREAPEGPRCIRHCPAHCLGLSELSTPDGTMPLSAQQEVKA